MKPIHLILLIVMNFFWGGTVSAFKVLASELGPGGVATLRFGFSALILLVCWRFIPGEMPRGRDLLKTAIMGVLVFVFAPRLQVAGAQRGQAGDVAVLVALEPLIASLGAALFLGEHIGPRRWIGFCLGLLGVVLMAEMWRPDFHSPGLVANGIFVLSFVCEAAYSLMGKPLIQRAGMMKVLTLALLAATIVNLSIDGKATLSALPHLSTRAWLLMAYLAIICTVLGYLLWFAVIRETEVNVTALTVFIQPVVGVITAVIILKEQLHWGQLWGSLAIVTGLAIALSRQVKTPKRCENLSVT